MKVIIDGVDLSGKTYAIERIAKKYNSGFIIKNSYKPKNKNSIKIYKQYWDIINLIENYDNLVILDRFFPSQAVYSVLRGKDEMLSFNISKIEQYCVKNKYKFIYLNTPIDILKDRYDSRGDEHIKKDQLLMLKNRYDIYYDLCPLDKIKVNTLEKNWLQQIEKFVGEIN